MDVTSPFLLQGTRITYVTEMFPFSLSLRVRPDDRRNWDPYQSATGAALSSALCRPPGPSYKADNRTGLYTEKVNYCCSYSNPNNRTWITLEKHALPLGRGTLWSHLLPEGVKWHLLMWSNPVGPYCLLSLRWLRLHHWRRQNVVCQGKHSSSKNTVENTYGIPTGSLIWALASHPISRIHWLKGLCRTLRHVWMPECWRTQQGMPG